MDSVAWIASYPANYLQEPEFQLFLRNLRLNRKNGYAVGKEGTEVGVVAIALPLRARDKHALAAFGHVARRPPS